MKPLLFVPIVLSLLVLGAHFLREQNTVGVVISIALIGLLALRRAWAARVVQAALVLAAVEWTLTIYTLAGFRAARGESATRMIIILGCVALVALISAFLFQTKALKTMYHLDARDRPEAD